MPKATKVSRVFISHGRSETVKLKLRTFLKERLGMEAVVLSEQPDLGLTVVEKLEKYGSECDFALIVLTADDLTVSGGARARQNVIHELGFFHGTLGRDRVLLLKQSSVELFSNISGLIYKEFEGDNIESVFEAIRIALESSSAQKGGHTVPAEEFGDMSERLSKSLDIVAYDWPRMERERLTQSIRQVINGLAPDLQVRRIKKFLEDEKIQYEARLAQAQAEAERRKETVRADPEHGGKVFAMTLSFFECVAPQSAIRLIDKLLSEISFLEMENMDPNKVVDRLIGICEADGQSG
jgi:hypothetical protein